MSRLTALSIAVAVFATAATPVLAQNASQIASVKRGASCAGCNLFQGDFLRS
jgi:NO-binding membrane sensor protein with MHYT domain